VPNTHSPPLPRLHAQNCSTSSSKGGARQRACNSFVQAGHATVGCVNGAITVNFTSPKGMAFMGAKNVVASCENSDFSAQSSCMTSNKAAVARSATATSVTLKSAEWDSTCTCTSTKRRPTFNIQLPEVAMGSKCSKP
jgi:hypothetical protein